MPHQRKVKARFDIHAKAVARRTPCPANGKFREVGYFGGARLCAKPQPQRCGWSATQPRSIKSAK